MNTSYTPKPEISIKDEISIYKRRILRYRRAVNNDEAIWLFLATLGCWSVTNIVVQFIALLLTWIIFIKRLTELSKKIIFFPKWKNIIENRLDESDLSDDSKKARRFELAEIDDVISIWSILKDSRMYFLCFLFYLLTLLNWSYTFYTLIK
jgi:hypothetical protein